MDDIIYNRALDELDDEDELAAEQPVQQRRVPPQITISEAFDILEAYKQKMVDENYEQMLEDGEADVKTPLEVVDALEVLLYFVNTSFNLDEEI